MRDDLDLEQLLDSAMVYHEAGQLDRAEAGYRSVLEHDPNTLDALNLLGIILQDRGEIGESISLLTRAVTIDPDFSQALLSLARAQRLGGAAAAAVATAHRAIALEPDLVAAHFQLGSALVDLGQHEAAAKALRRTVALAPEAVDALVLLGLALAPLKDPKADAEAVTVLRRAVELAPESLPAQCALAEALTRLNDHAAAAQAWQAALALKPDDPEMLLNLAQSLAILERFREALAAYRQADERAPGHPMAQLGLASTLAGMGNYDAVAEMCRRELDTKPDWPEMRLLLALCESRQGQHAAAAESYRQVLALRPRSGIVLQGLAATGQGFDDFPSDVAKDILEDASLPAQDRVAAGFALGQVLDQNGAYDDAFLAYLCANRLKRVARAKNGIEFDRNAFRAMIDHLIATIGPETFAATDGWGDPSDLPVFVVGMPRSGTTLVEQIAASHPLVFGAGELKDVSGILTALDPERRTCPPNEWDPALALRAAAAQLERLRDIGGDAARVIDKMPTNLLYLAHIAVLFPHARIVVCRRDPRDVGLSCFFQIFADDAMIWADDLADCGFRIRQMDRLMDHWRKILPLRILEIHYESLIENLENESRRLIDFLGLPWDPACLSFHRTQRTVETASHWQVRQPLYSSSVDRWRHYERHLEPLLRELERDGPDSAPMLTDLARAYRVMGNVDAGFEAAQRAVSRAPELPEALVQLGCALLARQDFAGAVEVLRRATATPPRSLEALTALATALTHQKEYAAAAEAWKMAVALKPDEFGMLLYLGQSLRAAERYEEAVVTYRRADALTKDHPLVLHGLADALGRLGDHAGATELCRRALTIVPDWSALWIILGTHEARQGHFDAAEAAYRRVLVLEPDAAGALHDLVAMGAPEDTTAAEVAARRILDDPSRQIRDRALAGYTVGRIRDRKGAYDEAFEFYTLANRLMREHRGKIGFAFDRKTYSDVVDLLISTVGPDLLAAADGWGDPSDLPVFVVGMPRSGTTLVEQIATSHPRIVGAGELTAIPAMLATLGFDQVTGQPIDWQRASVQAKTAAHVEHLNNLAGSAHRVIDKLPDNIGNLGQIAMLFPRARIILCRRDLRDVCLSCFFQHFQEDAMAWSDDLEDCGFRARETERLMDHWRKVVPLPILEIQYETLVANLESESRRLIEFLGVEWDPACLSFHKNERPVATASYWQVRQPLYSSSVGRWKYYERHLDPLMRQLAGRGLCQSS